MGPGHVPMLPNGPGAGPNKCKWTSIQARWANGLAPRPGRQCYYHGGVVSTKGRPRLLRQVYIYIYMGTVYLFGNSNAGGGKEKIW
jgi:hypothetical protein